MSAKLNELAGRRAVLTSRAAMQREQLARTMERFEQPARVVDNILSATRVVKKRPAIISSLSLFLLATQWRKLAKLPKRLYQAVLLLNVLRNIRSVRDIGLLNR